MLGALAVLHLSAFGAEKCLAVADIDPSTRVSINQSDDHLTLSFPARTAQVAIILASKPFVEGTISALPNVEALKNSSAVMLSFDLTASPGSSRSVSVLLARSRENVWSLTGEWSVERCDSGDSGSKNEIQHWTIAEGTLRRSVHRQNVEGIEYTLPCGCCKAIQTRTMETAEEEIFSWNDSKQTLERKAFKRWYLVQPGEGMFSVARKALGDARLMAKIVALNPELKRDTMLSAGQKVLVEKE
jgi:hypothetical protein